jgi:hypothetical protein
MEKITSIKIPLHVIALFLMLIILMIQTCGIKKSLRETNRKLDSLEVTTSNIKKLPSMEEINKTLKKNMYESLVIEEDVDKGVISISEIKKKKLENENWWTFSI